MNTFEAPNGEIINIPEGRIITFGLNDEQNDCVRRCLPTKNYELYVADDATDIISVPSVAQIIVASALSETEYEILSDYYTEIADYTFETVFWLGYPKPPFHVNLRMICHEYFEHMESKLKYYLLQSHKKDKSTKEFSRKIADALMILSLIRSNPGIKSKDIAEKLELSIRTVERNIATLQAAGEWIEYDTSKKGWRLYEGVSIFFGDHLKK